MARNRRHLKRHSMPISWPIKRKNINFITRSNPGSQKREYSVSLLVLLRDILKYAKTTKEAKIIANINEIFINGVQIKDIKFSVGIFDVFEIKTTKEKYIVIFDKLGKIKLVPTKEDFIYLKVSNKKVITGNKFQINFMNGFNLLVDEKKFKGIKLSDTVIFDFNKKKIIEILNLKEKNFVYILSGNFKGEIAEVSGFTHYNGIAKDVILIKIGEQNHSTAKRYCLTIGNKIEDTKRFI